VLFRRWEKRRGGKPGRDKSECSEGRKGAGRREGRRRQRFEDSFRFVRTSRGSGVMRCATRDDRAALAERNRRSFSSSFSSFPVYSFYSPASSVYARRQVSLQHPSAPSRREIRTRTVRSNVPSSSPLQGHCRLPLPCRSRRTIVQRDAHTRFVVCRVLWRRIQ
jgi:hypothetical protein